MAKSKRTATADMLNASALDAQFDGQTADSVESKPKGRTADDRPKDRITLRLYTDTLALLDLLKADARKHQRGATFGEVVEEAIIDLAKKYDISM